MNILFITTDWNTPYRIATGEYGGVGYYRAYGPAKELRYKNHHVDVLGHELGNQVDTKDIFNSYKEIFKKYDVVVIKQADTINVARLIGACKELKIPIAMDLDDLITELDPDNPATALGYKKGDAKQAFAIASLTMVDALFVSTQPLADAYTEYLQRVHKLEMPAYVLPNCSDPSLWHQIRRDELDKNIVLGWHGSITHDGDLAIIMPALQKLMKKYPHLHLSLTGGIRQETYDSMFVDVFEQDALNRIAINRGTPSFKNFPEYLSRHQWNIGLVPLKDTKFTRGKSHIKWMENSLVGIPTIASDVYPYKEKIQGTPVILDGITGLLAKNDQWEEKIESLLHNERMRRGMAKNARRFVMENWTYSKHIQKWEDAFSSVLNEGSRDLH